MKKPLPPTYFFAGLAAMSVLHLAWPIVRFLAFPWTLLGVAPLAAGILLNIAADKQFKRHNTTVKPFETSAHLVTEFPFSFTRNPMYLGMTLMLVGVAVLIGTLSPLVIAIAFSVLTDRAFIQIEERMLKDRFGVEWEVYASRVRRWL